MLSDIELIYIIVEVKHMKKQQRICLCTIIIASVLGLASIAYAACSHDSYYWDINLTETYAYNCYEFCSKTTYQEYECKICGEMWTTEGTSMVPHAWYRIDLGHIPSLPLHKFRTVCLQCGYSIDTEEFCPLTH